MIDERSRRLPHTEWWRHANFPVPEASPLLMTPSEPSGRHILSRPVLGLWAHHPITSFVISQLQTAHTLLTNHHLQFALKTEIQNRGLLTVPDLEALLASSEAALSRAGLAQNDSDDNSDDPDHDQSLVSEKADAGRPRLDEDSPPGAVYLTHHDATRLELPDDLPEPTEFVTPDGEVLPDPFDPAFVPATDPRRPPIAWQWPLSLSNVLTIISATDFLAQSHLGSFGDRMRHVQVEVQNLVSAETYDAQARELLHVLEHFQAGWREIFGHLPPYRARLEALAELSKYA